MNKGETKELHWGTEIIISQLETGDEIGAAPVPMVTGNNDLLVIIPQKGKILILDSIRNAISDLQLEV